MNGQTLTRSEQERLEFLTMELEDATQALRREPDCPHVRRVWFDLYAAYRAEAQNPVGFRYSGPGGAGRERNSAMQRILRSDDYQQMLDEEYRRAGFADPRRRCRKLTNRQVKQIQTRRKNGASYAQIARETGASPELVRYTCLHRRRHPRAAGVKARR